MLPDIYHDYMCSEWIYIYIWQSLVSECSQISVFSFVWIYSEDSMYIYIYVYIYIYFKKLNIYIYVNHINVISIHDHICICPVTTLLQVSILDILLRSSRKTTFEASSVAPNHRCSDGGAWFVDGHISLEEPCKRVKQISHDLRRVFCTMQTIVAWYFWIEPSTVPNSKVGNSKKKRNLPRSQFLNHQKMTRWWQLKYCFFIHPKNWRRFPILLIFFFRWVGSTTN